MVSLGVFARGAMRRGISKDQVYALARLIETGWGDDNQSNRQIMTTQLWPTATPDQIASFNHLQQVSCDGLTAANIILNTAIIDIAELLPSIYQPVLIVHSRYDFRQPLQEAEWMARKLPNATLCVLDAKKPHADVTWIRILPDDRYPPPIYYRKFVLTLRSYIQPTRSQVLFARSYDTAPSGTAMDIRAN